MRLKFSSIPPSHVSPLTRNRTIAQLEPDAVMVEKVRLWDAIGAMTRLLDNVGITVHNSLCGFLGSANNKDTNPVMLCSGVDLELMAAAYLRVLAFTLFGIPNKELYPDLDAVTIQKKIINAIIGLQRANLASVVDFRLSSQEVEDMRFGAEIYSLQLEYATGAQLTQAMEWVITKRLGGLIKLPEMRLISETLAAVTQRK